MTDDLIVRLLDDAAELLDARRLHARRYLEAGFIDHLDGDGVIDDPYVELSELISLGPGNFPALTEFEIWPDASRRIDAIDLASVVELSALAVARGATASRAGEVTRSLFRAMYQYSLLEAHHSHWLAAVDVRVARHLERSHGFLFEPIGHPKMYLGSETVPVICDLVAQLRHFRTVATRSGEYFCDGMVIDLTDDSMHCAGTQAAHVPVRGKLLA
jgi:hypothetical protein